MLNTAYLKKEKPYLIYLVLFALIWQISAQDDKSLWCNKEQQYTTEKIPEISRSFSTRVQLNYKSHGFTAEMFWKVDRNRKRDVIELKSSRMQGLYILRSEENAFFTIKYGLQGTVCTAEHVSEEHSVFEGENVDPLGVLRSLQEILLKTKRDGFRTLGSQSDIRGIPSQTWETCQYSDRLKAALFVSISFAKESWVPADSENPGRQGITRIQVEAKGPGINDIFLIADFYDFKSELFDDIDFQIPEYIYCPSYRTDKKQLPAIPSSFSYQSEITRYSSTSHQIEISHREVHYDYRHAIARVDYQGFEGQRASTSKYIKSSTIFDFNTDVQYIFDPEHGTCTIDVLTGAMDVLDEKKSLELSSGKMLNPSEYFNVFRGNAVSYNGVYKTRGLSADVFASATAEVTSPGIVKTQQLFWYFASDKTSILDTEGKNTLVKMLLIPEKNSAIDEEVHIHFYNFKKEQLNPKIFDITTCYNESLSKEFLITFPGHNNKDLEENTYLLKRTLQKYIKEVAGISLHRVYVQQIDFQSPYLLAQFKILNLPPVHGSRPVSPENNLKTAVQLLQKSVDENKFKVEIDIGNNSVIWLKPEPNGFKQFKPDRPTENGVEFNESSFVGMSIGMAVLGFLLGSVVVNLIFTRKYGVSLLQASGAPAPEMSFANPVAESSM